MDGSTLLSAHLDATGTTRSDLAARLRVAKSLVSMWLSGERRPGLQNAVALERITGVPHAAWLPKRSSRRTNRVRRSQ